MQTGPPQALPPALSGLTVTAVDSASILLPGSLYGGTLSATTLSDPGMWAALTKVLLSIYLDRKPKVRSLQESE